MPKLQYFPENDEYNYLWQGHEVTEVKVWFDFPNSGDPEIEAFTIYDSTDKSLKVWPFTEIHEGWFEKQLLHANEHEIAVWIDQQAERETAKHYGE